MQITYPINGRWLLSIYTVVPVVVLLTLIDTFFLNHMLWFRYFPRSLDKWLLLTPIFTLPHILASMLTMVDVEYFQHYRHRLILPLLFWTSVTAIGLYLDGIGTFILAVIMGAYTIYHLLVQQIGLSLTMLEAAPLSRAKAWKWYMIFTGLLIFSIIAGKSVMTGVRLLGLTLFEISVFAIIPLIIIITIFAMRLSPFAKNITGLWYLWCNVAMIASVCIVYVLGYNIFVFLIPRIIHDMTAFTIYIAHDRNRNAIQSKNIVYRIAGFSKLPIWILTPLIPIILAIILAFIDNIYISIFIITITFMHYHMEAIIWRRPHPHRSQIAFI